MITGTLTQCQSKFESNCNEVLLSTSQISKSDVSSSDAIYYHTLNYAFLLGFFPLQRIYSADYKFSQLVSQCKVFMVMSMIILKINQRQLEERIIFSDKAMT